MTGINLIPVHRILAMQRRIRVRLWMRIDSICIGGLLIICAVVTAVFDQSVANVADELAFLEEKVANVNRSIGALRPQLSEVKLTLEASRAVQKQPDWSVLLALLANLQGDQIVMRSVKTEPMGPGNPAAGVSEIISVEENSATDDDRSGYRLVLGGLGKTQSAVSQFVLRLEQCGLFERVTVIRTNREGFMSDHAVAFELLCTMGRAKETDS